MDGNLVRTIDFNQAELKFIELCLIPTQIDMPIQTNNYPRQPLSAIYMMVKQIKPEIIKDGMFSVIEYAKCYKREDGLVTGTYHEGYNRSILEFNFLLSLLSIWISEFTCTSPIVKRRIKLGKWQKVFQFCLLYYYCGGIVSNLSGDIVAFANERTVCKYDPVTWVYCDTEELNYDRAVSMIEIMHECKLSLKENHCQ